MAILAGLIAVILGLWGMIHWSASLWVVLQGLLPMSLVFAGVVALIVGLSAKPAPSGKKNNEKS